MHGNIAKKDWYLSRRKKSTEKQIQKKLKIVFMDTPVFSGAYLSFSMFSPSTVHFSIYIYIYMV